MSIPRVVIAGTHSGVGKTTVATGIMAALHRRGRRVQGFKVGPDFIDPTFHRAATSRPSHNLDGWILSREANLEIFNGATADADVAVVEGVMGLFDGKQPSSLSGTTAKMALWLDAPVVLVLDGAAIAGSAAAVVHGFDTLIPDLPLAAVVCNRVASVRHYELLREAITARCRPVPIGYLPRDPGFAVPERHLGLHLADEAWTAERVNQLADRIEAHLDLERLLRLTAERSAPAVQPVRAPITSPRRARIGIARDAAFCFYYEDNLTLLRGLGAELVEFSRIADRALPPEVDGIRPWWRIPGAARARIVGEHVDAGCPPGVCGRRCTCLRRVRRFHGTDGGDRRRRRTTVADGGSLSHECAHAETVGQLGYVQVETQAGEPWLKSGEWARGHEFRYSTIDPMPATIQRAYRDPAEGYRVRSVLGSYVHLHFRSCPAFATRFVEACRQGL